MEEKKAMLDKLIVSQKNTMALYKEAYEKMPCRFIKYLCCRAQLTLNILEKKRAKLA